MKVAKFGGTSLADAAQIRKVCDIVLADSQRKIVIVSAPGKRRGGDTKVTDLLIDCGKSFLKGQDTAQKMQLIVDRYVEIATALEIPDIISEITKDLRGRLTLDTSSRSRFMDNIKAAGEDNCAKIVARYLQSIGVDARYISPVKAGMIMEGDFGYGCVKQQAYDNLAALKDIPYIGIFPGFFGHNDDGDIITFPRGGSDITGAIVAAAIDAQVYENFTDVDYVYTVNPSFVKSPKPIKVITYKEMRELSYAGFNVYQEEALLPVYRVGIPVNIKNVNNPSCPGTLIVPEREVIGCPVIGIAANDQFCCLYMSKYLMNRELGFGRRVLFILEDEAVSFEHMPTGIDTLSVIIRESELNEARLQRIMDRIKNELEVDDINVERNLSVVMIVGEGMQHHVGITAKASKALAKADVNIDMISQGCSEVSMVFVIKNTDAARAVQAMYEEFFVQSA